MSRTRYVVLQSGRDRHDKLFVAQPCGNDFPARAEGDTVPEPIDELTPSAAVELALRTVARYRRPDLESRLRQARVRLDDGHVRVLVVGEFKQGKSLLVNGLVGAPVCPVRDDVATSIATVVSHAPKPAITLSAWVQGPDGRGAVRPVQEIEIPVATMADLLACYVTERGNPGNRRGLAQVEAKLPCRLLAGGLQIVDTPGVGGLRSVHGAATMAALPTADAVLLVSDASQEYTAPELEFLRQAIRLCPNVVCVLTKIDMYPEWRRIAELDAGHLHNAGIEADLIAVSSTLRWEALDRGDPTIDAESGFPALERYLVERVTGQADLLARRSTVHDVLAVTQQIGEALWAEEGSIRDPEAAERIIDELRRAQERAAALRERSSRWQLTLNDGTTDLYADVDHDLRDRMREIVRTVEDEIDDGGDPTRKWEGMCERLREQCAAAVSANYVSATQWSRALARRVATHFAEEHEAVLPALRIGRPPSVAGAAGDLVVRESEKWNLTNKALIALRGGYIGVLMVGMLGTVAGLALINPFSLGAGVLLGGKAISDERRRIIARRQAEAKAAVRRYVDEVAFQVGKESREMLRTIQRDLRDHYSQLADQLAASIKDSVASAERSVRTTQAEREQRLEEIPQELSVLGALRDQVSTLLTMPVPSLEATMMFQAIAGPSHTVSSWDDSSDTASPTDLVPVVRYPAAPRVAPVPAPRPSPHPRDAHRTGGSHALRSADGSA
jgi:Dynamin family